MPEPERNSDEQLYWDGYSRGLKEASEIWVACINDAMDGRGGWYREDPSAIVNWILKLADRELGFKGKLDSSGVRRVDDSV